MKIQTYNTTRQNLINAPLPEETRTYKVLSHEELIDLTLNSISNAGFTLESEKYTSARAHQVATGRYVIKEVADSEMKLQIGWQNSYNKQVSAKFAMGVHIIICANGMVHGDMGAFKKKHTGTIQEFVPQHITEYIKRAGDMFSHVQKERDKMKTINLTRRSVSELLGRMIIEERIITSTQLNIIAGELENPSYDYKCPGTMWELYNHVSHSMKELHPSLYLEQHKRAHKFFTENSDTLTAPQILVPEDIKQLELFG